MCEGLTNDHSQRRLIFLYTDLSGWEEGVLLFLLIDGEI